MSSILKKITAPHKNISLDAGTWINLIIISAILGFILGWVVCYDKFYNMTNYAA